MYNIWTWPSVEEAYNLFYLCRMLNLVVSIIVWGCMVFPTETRTNVGVEQCVYK